MKEGPGERPEERTEERLEERLEERRRSSCKGRVVMADDQALKTLAETAGRLARQAPEKFQSLLDFGAFLQADLGEEADTSPQVPLDVPRPEKESVVAAIKRLAKTYPMLDKKILFEQTSVAMSAHVLEQVPPKESIDRLEAVFAGAYQRYLVSVNK